MNLTPPLSADESRFLTKVMTMGLATNLPVQMTSDELAKLIGVIFHDNDRGPELDASIPGIWGRINPNADYYGVDPDWFLDPIGLAGLEHIQLMRLGVQHIQDFTTYLRCLSELHKRRRKYAMILSAQPIPTMVQVSPRALVEYGPVNPEALASWLTWRKFFYDLDNRAAQETGYLFEPILAAAIGGEPKGARAKVVTRENDPNKGRQVDCWKVRPTGKPLAYEFKLRVTIAASGQGRMGEEVQFAKDAKHSGAVPILLVLDPTMNVRLDELQRAYNDAGGKAYLGDDAWEHLEQEAGDVMSRFIEKYVRRPIAEISAFETARDGRPDSKHINLLDLSAQYANDTLYIKLGDHVRKISRNEVQSLLDDDEDEPEQ